jgi:hypothetical protein
MAKNKKLNAQIFKSSKNKRIKADEAKREGWTA